MSSKHAIISDIALKSRLFRIDYREKTYSACYHFYQYRVC